MIPFEHMGLQRIAKLSDDCRRACMFQTLIVIQPQDDNTNTQSHTELGRWLDVSKDQGPHTYPFTVEIFITTASIKTTAHFDPSAIQPWLVRALLKRVETVVHHQLSSAGPSQCLSSVNSMAQDDMDRIWGWNKVSPEPIDRCVHGMIEERVRTQPDLPAICAWDGSFTHSEVDEKAIYLSKWLVANLDTVSNTFIPLYFEKSKWTPVAMLAVMKAGAAFVLLDPSTPRARLQEISQQLGNSLVLCSASCQELSLLLGQRALTIDHAFFSEDLTNGNIHHTALPSGRPSDIIYLLFTSASTGGPKGTIITHRSAATALVHQPAKFGFTSESRLYDFSSYAFDAPIFNTLNMLVSGGCLCIPSDGDRQTRLSQSFVSLQANTILLTPSVARILRPGDHNRLLGNG